MTRTCLTLNVLLVTLLSTPEVMAFDPADYPPSTISAAINKVTQQVQSDPGLKAVPKERLVIPTVMTPFRTAARVVGAMKDNLRPLSAASRALLNIWDKSTKQSLLRLFHKELRVSDGDGKNLLASYPRRSHQGPQAGMLRKWLQRGTVPNLSGQTSR